MTLLPEAQCCFGHGRNDQWYEQYHPDPKVAKVGGLTNMEALKLLMPNRGPQWELGGTAIFEHFRFDHCEENKDKDRADSVHLVLGKTFGASSKVVKHGKWRLVEPTSAKEKEEVAPMKSKKKQHKKKLAQPLGMI